MARKIRLLLAVAAVACAATFGGADTASANHRTYCGHGHSGGYDHGGRPGDGTYFWSQFVEEKSFKNSGGTWYHYHRYIEVFHNRSGNHAVDVYWKLCGIGTNV
jgi:hypothetical protein